MIENILRKVIIMCNNALKHSAIIFINSNKAEKNINKIIQENRPKFNAAGIIFIDKCIVSKGPNRDIDRDAINVLINALITGLYDTVVVKNMTDITADKSDLKEFMRDAYNVGVSFFELSTMQYYMYDTASVLPIKTIKKYRVEAQVSYEDKQGRYIIC